MVGVEPTVTKIDLYEAMMDLKKAMRLSFFSFDSGIEAYEIDGTAKTIICAVNQLVARRKCGDRK